MRGLGQHLRGRTAIARLGVGLVTGVVALAGSVGAGPAGADPPGTVLLDVQRIEIPELRVVGASAAGVLYSQRHPDTGTGLPAGDPSGLQPAGKPPVHPESAVRRAEREPRLPSRERRRHRAPDRHRHDPVGSDRTARLAPNSSYSARPRYLGNAITPASFASGGRWNAEFGVSKALPVCGVTIRRGTTVIRSLGCATSTGSAQVSWDGRDSAGRPVPKGTYGWTFNGRDADGWLLWWNGAAKPVTGAVTVS